MREIFIKEREVFSGQIQVFFIKIQKTDE